MALKTIVFVEIDTHRILGFGPEGLKPLFPIGTRYREVHPFDAHEYEKWLKKYRDQAHNDAQEKVRLRTEREKHIRDAIKSAIRGRNLSVNRINRDCNNALIEFMDREYDRVMTHAANPETFGVAEAYEESKAGEDVALEAPMFRKIQ